MTAPCGYASVVVTPAGFEAVRRAEAGAAAGAAGDAPRIVFTVQMRPDITPEQITAAMDILTGLPGADTVTVTATQ